MLKSCHPSTIVLLLFLGFALSMCHNNSNNAARPDDAIAKVDSNFIAIPDQQDLLEILAGNWQSDTDSLLRLTITDSLMTRWSGGQVLQQSRIEVDATCSAGACSAAGSEDDGWCFIEKTPAGDRCLKVLHCDKKTLKLRSITNDAPEMVFRKL